MSKIAIYLIIPPQLIIYGGSWSIYFLPHIVCICTVLLLKPGFLENGLGSFVEINIFVKKYYFIQFLHILPK